MKRFNALSDNPDVPGICHVPLTGLIQGPYYIRICKNGVSLAVTVGKEGGFLEGVLMNMFSLNDMFDGWKCKPYEFHEPIATYTCD